MKTIDLNADAGEIPSLIADGSQEELMRWLSSVNIACGAHGGDEEMMRITAAQARAHGVAIGAHPGYPDRENFGRLPVEITVEELARSVEEQVRALARAAGELRHVKPHGALYNVAARNARVAEAVAAGVARVTHDVVLVGLAGSVMLEVFHAAGFRAAAEAFADRRYESDGGLRNRRLAGSLIVDAGEAAAQAAGIALDGMVTAADGSLVAIAASTICVHGDTPGAADIARAVRVRLEESGVRVQALKPRS